MIVYLFMNFVDRFIDEDNDFGDTHSTHTHTVVRKQQNRRLAQLINKHSGIT